MPQKYHSKNQSIGLHSDLLILHKKKTETQQKDCLDVQLVSYLSPAYGGSDVTVAFFKETKEDGDNLSKNMQIATVALNRAETKLAMDISFVIVQFQTMHYFTI